MQEYNIILLVLYMYIPSTFKIHMTLYVACMKYMYILDI